MEKLLKKGKFFLLLFIARVFGQSVKRLNDPPLLPNIKE
jgi:hypothetical protein